jgi:hypothetical protein
MEFRAGCRGQRWREVITHGDIQPVGRDRPGVICCGCEDVRARSGRRWAPDLKAYRRSGLFGANGLNRFRGRALCVFVQGAIGGAVTGACAFLGAPRPIERASRIYGAIS